MQSSGRPARADGAARVREAAGRWCGLLWLLSGLAGCGDAVEGGPLRLIGKPGGPYQVTLEVDSAAPQAGRGTLLTFRVTHAKTHTPVSDLQILHERALHTFIAKRDFSSFAHTHHEDFGPLSAQDRQHARFAFPYTFPAPGEYLIVNEFTHKDRSWTKHFTLTVDGADTAPAEVVRRNVKPDFRLDKRFGAYRVALRTSPSPPLAGREVELVCRLSASDGSPITNLGLYLGTEVHMASWRLDAAHFGHQHTYTSKMARLMADMRDDRMPAAERARLMVRLMREPPRQEYFGPEVPLHHVFPAPGVYKIFLEFAPNGEYLAADFWIEVAEYSNAADTTIRSILPGSVTAASES